MYIQRSVKFYFGQGKDIDLTYIAIYLVTNKTCSAKVFHSNSMFCNEEQVFNDMTYININETCHFPKYLGNKMREEVICIR